MNKFIMLALFLMLPEISIAVEQCENIVGPETYVDKMTISSDVPNFLKGAKITVKLADGKESTVPAKLFKVVPRKQYYFVNKTILHDRWVCKETVEVTKTVTEMKKNRISVMGGSGPTEGLSDSKTSSMVEVESNVGAIGAAQYQRMLNDKVSAGVQLQTNKSWLLELGLDF